MTQAGLFLAMLLLLGCSDPEPTDSEQNATVISSTEGQVFKSDLSGIRKRGVIRFLIPPWANQALPREGLTDNYYKDLAQAYANSLNLKVHWIKAHKFNDLIPMLNAGKGDIIVSNLTLTQQRQNDINFSRPLFSINEQVVLHRKHKNITQAKELNNLTIGVPQDSAYLDSLAQLNKSNQLNIKPLDAQTSPDQILDLINQDIIDGSLIDSNTLRGLAHYRSDFHLAFSLDRKRDIAWGVRKNNADLLTSLNDYLTQHLINSQPGRNSTKDLSSIKKAGVIRLLTRNNAATYFMLRGDLMGFEYELSADFAKSIGLDLEVVVVPYGESLADWLNQGKGDFVAASQTISKNRFGNQVTFSRYYNKINEVFLGTQDKPYTDINSLAKKSIIINPSSHHWQSLTALQQQGITFDKIIKRQDLSSEELVNEVVNGNAELTLLDSHMAAIEQTLNPDLNVQFKLNQEQQLGMLVRSNNPELLTALNSYLKRSYRGLTYNILYNKYFKTPRKINQFFDARNLQQQQLSPYDNLIKPLARKFDFAWPMIVAQMFQESRFDPKAKSFANALGLMQVLPRTAAEFNISQKQLLTPDGGITAGIQYLDWTRQRFPSELPTYEQQWFALASYNAGFGHVQDARKLATKQGWDKNQWFNHTEKAMLLLSKKQYSKQARYGYVRGHEPVNYVRQIRQRYQGYLDALGKTTGAVVERPQG